MEDLLEDKHVITAELWRVWAERGKRHDRAILRKIIVASALVTGLVTVAFVLYLSVMK